MTDEIRALVREEMVRQGLTLSSLAAELGTTRTNLSRLLSTSNSDVRAGGVEFWKRLLERLGYELVAVPIKKEAQN